MKTYNKLVRDNIPNMITCDGKTCDIKTLDQEQYKVEIRKKIIEEAIELSGAKTDGEIIDELADIFELLDYLLIEEKIDLLKVTKRRIQKNMEKGGFDQRLYLKSVKE